MKSELHQIYEKLKTEGVVNLHIATVSLKTISHKSLSTVRNSLECPAGDPTLHSHFCNRTGTIMVIIVFN